MELESGSDVPESGLSRKCGGKEEGFLEYLARMKWFDGGDWSGKRVVFGWNL